MNIRWEINTQRKQRDGTHAIRVDLRHNGRHRDGIGEAVPEKHWDEAKQRVKIGNAQHARINAILAARTQRLTDLAKERPEATAKELWALSEKAAGGRMTEVLRPLIDHPKFEPGTRSVLRTSLNHAEQAIPDVSMGSLSVSDVVKFRKHLADLGLSPNTVHTQMRMLRLLYNLALEQRGQPPTAVFRRQLPTPEEPQARILSVEQVRTFASAELKGDPAIARDTWMLSVYLGCLRFGDVVGLKPTNIEGGGVQLRAKKTGKLHWVPLLPQAQAIIDRYKGGKHLLPMLDRISPVSVNQWVNDRLKIAAAQCGLPTELTMHWARHSGTNFLLSLEIPLDILQMILGHSNIQQTIDYAAKFDRKRVTEAMEKLGRAMAG